jgi:hypothetical protein
LRIAELRKEQSRDEPTTAFLFGKRLASRCSFSQKRCRFEESRSLFISSSTDPGFGNLYLRVMGHHRAWKIEVMVEVRFRIDE